ncbi:hypothetical protein BsWGS_18913 [Bradybaena similaris]
MDLPCEGFILLVGDGDFSFTLSLMQKGSLKSSHVTTSSLETLESIQHHKLAAENMSSLTEMGVRVFLETDACELHTHPVISQGCYQRVIFNFPLAHRHDIRLNRALLADFFSSCSHILSDDGQVMVTLCKGQGGTPADQPMRCWHDSWQVQAMAASAGFILSHVLPFEACQYPAYHSVGFRFQDKSFSTDGALIHVFEKADVVVVADAVRARGVVQCDGVNYTCSRYVADKLTRDLLKEPNHPLRLLRQRLEESLSSQLEAEIQLDRDCWRVHPGHKSSISSQSPEPASGDGESQHLQDSLKTVKDRKNKTNLTILKSAKTAPLVHGVDRQNCQGMSGSRSLQDRDFRQDLCQMVPGNPESVFILIKKSVETRDCRKENSHPIVTFAASSVQGDNDAEEFSGSTAEPGGDTSSSLDSHCVQIEAYEVDVTEASRDLPGEAGCEETHDQLTISCTDRVYHCRTSLLESLQQLHLHVNANNCLGVPLENVSTNLSSWPVSGATDAGSLSSEQVNSASAVDNLSSGQVSGASAVDNLSSGQVSGTTTVDSLTGQYQPSMTEIWNCGVSETPNSRHCFVVSGKCFLPGEMTADTMVVRHEMMIVQKIPHGDGVWPAPRSSRVSRDSLAAANHFSNQFTQQQHQPPNTECSDHSGHLTSALTDVENLTSALTGVLSCLVQACQCAPDAVSVEDAGSAGSVTLVGAESVTAVKLIYLRPETSTRQQMSEQPQQNSCRVLAGVVYQFVIAGENMVVVVLHLDNIVCRICNIDDPRVLWSQSKKFTDQFQPASLFPQQFQQFSLYPMRFSHDLSFWQKDSDSEFDVLEMYNIILYTAGDLVYSVSLRDIYTEPDTGRVSRCYRLQFMSHDRALPYLVSWKLQSLIRLEVSQKLGITLR